MSLYGKLTSGLVGAWFVISLGASALHVYQTGPNQPPVAFGLAALTPILIFLVWFASSPEFRRFTMSLNPRVLTFIHTLRIEGFVFLVLATYGILPRAFALPAGWGDIFIGITAPFAALKLATFKHRRSFVAWQVLGMIDLATAVTLGTLVQALDPRGISTSAMTVLPMSLIPTFGVPLFLILHVICIAQAVRWPAQQVEPYPRNAASVSL